MSHTVGQTTTEYTWDVVASLPVVLQDGENTYVYGLALISATDGQGDHVYYLYDGLGSVTEVTDESGDVVASYGYDVFGAIRVQTGTSGNYWLFTGEQRDEDSGMYYLRARYYDPGTGRFLTQDPFLRFAMHPSSQDPYPYVTNNPVNLIDPYGLIGLPKVPNPVNAVKDAINAGKDALEAVADAFMDAFGPPYTFLEVVQILDVLPLQTACPFFGGVSIAFGPAGLGGAAACQIAVTGINVVAFGSTMYAVWTSDCQIDRKLASGLNVANLTFDNPLPGHLTLPIEAGLYVATNELLKCKE